MTNNIKNHFDNTQGVELKTNNELDYIHVSNSAAEATIFLQGAQVGTFQKNGQSPTLFLSDSCTYKKGSPLRGGVPVCWPWFGDLDQNEIVLQNQLSAEVQKTAPAHGFARDVEWKIHAISTPTDSLSIVELSLTVADDNPLWPFATKVIYKVEVSDTLKISMTVQNLSQKDFIFTQALHTYFQVSDIDNVSIKGLADTSYLDKLDNDAIKQQSGDITITEETDRIYKAAPALITLLDGDDSVEISNTGSQSTIVWNPWTEKGANLSQFGKLDYKQMVCIESANTLDSYVTLKAGESYSMSISID